MIHQVQCLHKFERTHVGVRAIVLIQVVKCTWHDSPAQHLHNQHDIERNPRIIFINRNEKKKVKVDRKLKWKCMHSNPHTSINLKKYRATHNWEIHQKKSRENGKCSNKICTNKQTRSSEWGIIVTVWVINEFLAVKIHRQMRAYSPIGNR